MAAPCKDAPPRKDGVYKVLQGQQLRRRDSPPLSPYAQMPRTWRSYLEILPRIGGLPRCVVIYMRTEHAQVATRLSMSPEAAIPEPPEESMPVQDSTSKEHRTSRSIAQVLVQEVESQVESRRKPHH